MFSLFVLVLAVAFAGNLRLKSEMHVKDCGTEATLIHFTDYKVSDLERSEDLTFDSGYATLNKNVTSGEVRFYATRNSDLLLDHTFDYCGEQYFSLPLFIGKLYYTGSDCSAPRPINDHFSSKLHVPWFTPSGKYELTINATSTDGQNIFCLYGWSEL